MARPHDGVAGAARFAAMYLVLRALVGGSEAALSGRFFVGVVSATALVLLGRAAQLLREAEAKQARLQLGEDAASVEATRDLSRLLLGGLLAVWLLQLFSPSPFPLVCCGAVVLIAWLSPGNPSADWRYELATRLGVATMTVLYALAVFVADFGLARLPLETPAILVAFCGPVIALELVRLIPLEHPLRVLLGGPAIAVAMGLLGVGWLSTRAELTQAYVLLGAVGAVVVLVAYVAHGIWPSSDRARLALPTELFVLTVDLGLFMAAAVGGE